MRLYSCNDHTFCEESGGLRYVNIFHIMHAVSVPRKMGRVSCWVLLLETWEVTGVS